MFAMAKRMPNNFLDILAKGVGGIISDVIDRKYVKKDYRIILTVESIVNDNTGILVGQRKINKSMSRYQAEGLLDTVESMIHRI